MWIQDVISPDDDLRLAWVTWCCQTWPRQPRLVKGSCLKAKSSLQSVIEPGN